MISCDSQVDAVYIRFIEGPAQVTTQQLSEDVAVNYAPDGRIVGIEILDASQYMFTSDKGRQVIAQNLIAVSA